MKWVRAAPASTDSFYWRWSGLPQGSVASETAGLPLPGGCCVCACMAAGASVVFAPSLHVQQGTAFHTATPLFLFLYVDKKKKKEETIIGPALCTLLYCNLQTKDKRRHRPEFIYAML